MTNIYSNRESDGTYSVKPTNADQNAYLQNLGIIEKDTDGAITYSIGTAGNLIMGQQNLVQRIIKSIFTLKGSNAYDTNAGSNFFHLFGTRSLDEIDEIKGQIPVLIQTTIDSLKKQDIEYESTGETLQSNEKLQDLILENVIYDETYGGWIMTIRIITAQNNSILLTVQ
jgi:hypothetical protein